MSSRENIDVNQRQKDFYEYKRKNIPTRIWSYFRNGILTRVRKDIGVEREIYELHKKWLGDLSDKKVLDLGCYSGNSLSLYIAANAKQYIGIDLSERGILKLEKKIHKFPSAKAVSIDFLSQEFAEKDFDLIYAYGVLHHFRDTDRLISRLKEKLSPKGQIISNDPLQTSLPIKLVRTLYRPFQTDKDWEWPFTQRTYYKFQNAFTIKERRGVLGKTKWFFLFSLLPVSIEKKLRTGKKWHNYDWEESNHSDSHMFSCMHLTMLMQKKD